MSDLLMIQSKYPMIFCCLMMLAFWLKPYVAKTWKARWKQISAENTVPAAY